MDDERTIHLLQEIRDIQRDHLESYRRGLQNQEESIRMQREMQEDYRRRMRMVFILVAVVLVLAGALLARLLFAFT
jgi:hypothetical protein